MSVKLKIDSLIDNYHQAMNKLNCIGLIQLDSYQGFNVRKGLMCESRARKNLRNFEFMKTSRELLRWCREGESNPHEVALAGF